MAGLTIRYFSTGGEDYVVNQIEDSAYGHVYQIYRTSSTEAPKPVYPTIYRREAVDVFVQNIYDGNIDYDFNL